MKYTVYNRKQLPVFSLWVNVVGVKFKEAGVWPWSHSTKLPIYKWRRDEPLEFEKSPIQVQNFRQIAHHRGIYRTYIQSNKYRKKRYLHVTREIIRATSHTSQEPWPWTFESLKESVQRPSQHTSNQHVVWSRTLKCSVKLHVTAPSTKCYFSGFLSMWVLTHDKIEYTNGCERSECHGLPVLC